MVGFSGFLTFSRNAWLGILVTVPIILGKKSIRLILPILFVLFLIFLVILTGDYQNNIHNFFAKKILLEFTEEGYKGLDATRFEIFSNAINLIKLNPIFGIGAGSFTQIFLSETNFWKGHSHNLFLELSLSYGLPATLIFLTTIFMILFLSGRKIFKKETKIDNNLFDRAFWAALFYFMISQLVDIQYFDGKISIVAWTLISGLNNIISENKNDINLKSKCS